MTSPSPQAPVRLDIFADPVCPWCHVGRLNLERALADRPGHGLEILWHPFRLNPDLPQEGVAKRAFLEEKLGGAARLDEIHAQLRAQAAKVGVDLDPDRPQVLPNTLDAQRLIHWASLEGLQAEVVAGLYQAYWDEGRDIGAAEVLADIAETAGMSGAAILRLLASDADRDDLIARDLDARQKGVTSVPTFLVAKTYVVAGAQNAEFWVQVIDELRASSQTA